MYRLELYHFYPTACKDCAGIVFTYGVRIARKAGSGKMLIWAVSQIVTLVRGCMCEMSWFDLDFTFDLDNLIQAISQKPCYKILGS